ncbi:hypothetical protein CONCODRAFT_6251 [Conidiobolus coronatus NRRL 28638]|uniref:Zn(2)-C6 fungal-type domain-containing protein n=1 Tax=Conidiobolus coronatus (strain ATCC 28846 / CBS 209.66 / NRRL 28638) TaxID=796925 RepID=A0A137P7W4_CONC2|nr:hypothetical protein CONCODRAFT_6251 [Conidiobolus coronatus NRRL 28638]|eukprot:KXN71088.1 hypothetical protein CONCODRAFT_6251 [Conidiobolus coronatus NRRL 28638]
MNQTITHQYSSPKLIGRACDLCRKAKIKCKLVGNQNCESCLKKGKLCQYLTVPKKRGPKPKLHSQLAEYCEPNQQFVPLSPATTEPSSPLQPSTPSYCYTLESSTPLLPEYLQNFMTELNPHLNFFTPSSLELRLLQSRTQTFDFLLKCIEICTFVWTLPPPYQIHPLSYLSGYYQEYYSLAQCNHNNFDLTDLNQSIYLLNFIQDYTLMTCGKPSEFAKED